MNLYNVHTKNPSVYGSSYNPNCQHKLMLQLGVCSQPDDPLKPAWSNSTQPIELSWFLEIGGLGLFKKNYDKSS